MQAWDLSCVDWEARIRAGQTLIPDLPLFKGEADEALGFFNDLRLPDVRNTPRLEEMAGDWAKDIVRAAFGSWDARNQVRYIREIFAMAPKGSSKTTYSAGIALTALLMNVRKRAELLIVAETQSISELAFNAIRGMIEEDRELSIRFDAKAYSSKFEVYDRVTGSTLRIKSFATNILTGTKPVFVLLDELHLLGKMSGAAKVLVQIRGGLQKNAEGLLVIITTQSDEPPKGVFRDELQAARNVRDGKTRDTGLLPILYEFPKAIAKDRTQWGNPRNWHMVSPNLGRSVQIHDLERGFAAAQEKGKAEVQIWASQHLNIQIGVGLSADSWAGGEYWERGIHAGITLEYLLANCDVICGGVDGGGLDDLLGLGFVGRHSTTKRWFAWCHAYVAPEGWERRKANWTDYEQFVKDGDLTKVDHLPGDIDALVEVVKIVKASGLLYKMGVDGAGIGGVVDAFEAIGITQEAEMLEPIRQGMGLMGAIKTVERKLVDGTFKHNGNRMLGWCAGNAKVSLTPTGMRIARDASGAGKIDPLMAVLNAADLMATNPQSKRSVYESRGLRVA
jgi:phage terminase large subunit-like protein